MSNRADFDIPQRCQPGEHDWEEDYYGQVCRICGDFMPNIEEDCDEIPEHGTCQTCGGEWGDGWSNCTCDEDDLVWPDDSIYEPVRVQQE